MTDRFVLTPALRVLDGTPAEDGNAAQNADSDVDEPGLEFVRKSNEDSPPKVTEVDWERITEGDAKTKAELSSSRGELEARIAELEAAVARSREEWEPDGSEPDAEEMPERHIFAHGSPENPAKAESIESVFDGAPQNGASESPSDAATAEDPGIEAAAPKGEKPNGLAAGDFSDDLVLDEDALRDMVTDIVRSELQGALGEKITRNVRRMVRREVQQALALKDFE